MYPLTKKLIEEIKEIISLKENSTLPEQSLATSHVDLKHQNKNLLLHKRLENLLNDCTWEELILIQTVAEIGRCERGYRQYSKDGRIEIIHLEISENEHELIEKYSRFLKFKSKEELIFSILRNTTIHHYLREGLSILKL